MGVASNLTKFEALSSAVAATTAGVVSVVGKNKSCNSFQGEDFSESVSTTSNSFSVDKAFETMMKNGSIEESKFGDSSVASNATNYYSVMKRPECLDNKYNFMKMTENNKCMIFNINSSSGINDTHNAMALFSTTDFSNKNIVMFERRGSFGDGDGRERPRSDPEKTIFIDNVNNDVTEDEMKTIFGEYGSIVSVRLLNRRTDLPGKCFLEFEETS